MKQEIEQKKEENLQTSNHAAFFNGLKAGIPIGIGYLSVSFTFGIMAVSSGFYWWQAVLISMMNLTSAGQFAGIDIMQSAGRYMEMFITQFTINIRYSIMAVALSQKTEREFRGIYRLLLGAGTTDEIFAVAIMQESVSRVYYFGLQIIPYIGWAAGTLIGAILGNLLPSGLISALGLAIYGMFVAIVIPEMKKAKSIVFVVMLALILRCIFTYVPLFRQTPSGIAVSICAVAAAAAGAVLFPQKQGEE